VGLAACGLGRNALGTQRERSGCRTGGVLGGEIVDIYVGSGEVLA